MGADGLKLFFGLLGAEPAPCPTPDPTPHLNVFSCRMTLLFIIFGDNDLFRITFENSELGRMKRLLPLREMSVNFGLYVSMIWRQSLSFIPG